MTGNRKTTERHGISPVRLVVGWELLKSAAGAVGSIFGSNAKNLSTGEPEKSERAADINEDLRNGVDFQRRERWGTVLVACALIAAVAGAVGFVFVYWTDAGNMLLGGSLAIFLAGFGSMCVLWAHWLMRHKQAIERREELPPPPAERLEFVQTFSASAHDVRRRTLLKCAVAAALGSFAAIIVSMLRSLGMLPGAVLDSPVWKRGQRLMTEDGKAVTVDWLQSGNTVIVFPEDKLGHERAQTVLIRVKEQSLDLPADRADWAPKGYVAYSRVCTHAGCPVGLYEVTSELLLCPCHQSTFNILRAAEPTSGPAARALPQLPLYADENGFLCAGGDFTEPPGPGYWWL